MSGLLDLLPMAAGGIFGAVVKLISLGMENRRRQQEQIIALSAKKQESIDAANHMANTNVWFGITRRIIALSLTALVAFVVFAPIINPGLPIFAPQTITEGSTYLFGLIDTTTTKVVWDQLRGFVMHPIVVQSFQVVVGTYLGGSLAGRS